MFSLSLSTVIWFQVSLWDYWSQKDLERDFREPQVHFLHLVSDDSNAPSSPCLQTPGHAKLLLSCPILCNAMDYSPPGSTVHGILQAIILGWVALPSSRGSSQPRDGTHISLVAQTVKNQPAGQEMQVPSLGWEDPLEEEMAIQSTILVWRIPWTEELGGLQSIVLQRVRHD